MTLHIERCAALCMHLICTICMCMRFITVKRGFLGQYSDIHCFVNVMKLPVVRGYYSYITCDT